MSDYDSNKPSSFITYLDKNNFYGLSMSEYLPYGEFNWLKNVDKFDVNSINEKSDIGYILEVDLEYPKELHKLHNNYPLAPEKRAVTNDMLSKYCKEIADKYDIKVGDVKKLIPNLGNKTKYVVHYRNLHLYLSLGMKLTKIHRALKFKQSDRMKKYIDFNTRLFKGITSNHNGYFYCLSCFHSFCTDNSLKKHERLCNNNDYCHIAMPEKGKNILKYIPGEKSLKAEKRAILSK